MNVETCGDQRLLCTTGASAAQDIALTSRDGSVELSGTLLGFDGEFTASRRTMAS